MTLIKETEISPKAKVINFHEIEGEDLQNIKEIEKQYPEMAEEYKRICVEQFALFCKKQLDYGPDNITVGTPLQTKDDIKLSLSGLWFRINDKVQRLKQLIVLGKQTAVKEESVIDTYQDLSIYGIIAQLVKNGKWAK